MSDVIARGKSLNEILTKWSEVWNCSPEDIALKVLQTPNSSDAEFTVQLTFKDIDQSPALKGQVTWDETKYIVNPEAQVIEINPFPLAGKIIYQGKEMFERFPISKGENFEYYPLIKESTFTWQIKAEEDGSQAIAYVKHEHPGRFKLKKNIVWEKRWLLEENIEWEDFTAIDYIEFEEMFKEELNIKGIIAGIETDYWQNILEIIGIDEVHIAKQIDPIFSLDARLEDFESEEVEQLEVTDKVDYFASKIIVYEKDQVIARKIPGKEGISGVNIFGVEIPVQKMQDFQLKAKKNVYLTRDGLEVRAMFNGAPIKLGDYSYALQKIYYVNNNIDLNTGSVEFPGDVIVMNNVCEGFHVYSDGRVNIKGIVSGAVIKAESGIDISSNVFNSKIILGEKHYNRLQFIIKLELIEKRLNHLFMEINKKYYIDINLHKLLIHLLENQFVDIKKNVIKLNNLMQIEDETFFTREIIAAVHALKYFSEGLQLKGIQDTAFLNMAHREIRSFLIEAKAQYTNKNATIIAGYVQNSEIKCCGDFVCRSDVFNSDIKTEGEIKIFGVCRGSNLSSEKKIYVYELGSSEAGTDTIIQLPESGLLTAEYCHSNVKIILGQSITTINESVRKLDVYIENGKVIVDKLKWFKDE